jgi:hypothetical protein
LGIWARSLATVAKNRAQIAEWRESRPDCRALDPPEITLSAICLQKLAHCAMLTSLSKPPTSQETDMPTFPKFDRTKFEAVLPKIDLPEVELPSAEKIADCARNAVYVSVGLVVTTVERLQSAQDRIVDTLKDGVAKVRSAA